MTQYINDVTTQYRYTTNDANETAYFSRELEKIMARVYQVPRKPLKALDLFPITNEASPADEIITWREWDGAASVIFAEDYITEIPRAEVWATEQSTKVHSMVSGYQVSKQELRQSQQTGKDIPGKRYAEVRHAFDRTMDNLAWNGDSAKNIQGFIGISGTNEYTVPNGAGGFKTFSKKTADEILADLFAMETTIIENTNEVETPDTLLMPIAQERIISTKRMPDGDKNTVLRFFLDNAQYIKRIVTVPQLKGAGAGGTDRMVAFQNSDDKLALEIPVAFEQFPAIDRGFYYTVDAHARYAGFMVFRPLSICIADGI